MSSCSRHPSREGVGACINCGELVCTDCRSEIDGKTYCPVCVDKLFAVEKKEAEPVPAAASVADRAQPVAAAKSTATEGKSVDSLWWLAPILLAVVGGLLAWLVNREADARKALNMLWTGIGMTLIQGVLAVILVFAICVPVASKVAVTFPPASSKPPASAGQAAPGADAPKQPVISKQPATPPAQADNPGRSGVPKPSGQASAGPREITIEVKPPAQAPKPAPPAPTYQTKPLVTQPLKPSDEAQTVKYEDKLSVTVPGGGLKGEDTLTISEVTNLPEWNDGQRSDIAVYDISFNTNHTFDEPLTYEFPYDATDAAQGEDETFPGVAYLGSDGKTWIDMPVSVDEANHKITVSTTHNSIWRYYLRYLASSVMETAHFRVAYWQSDFTPSTWTKKDQDEMENLRMLSKTRALTAEEEQRRLEMVRRFSSMSTPGGAGNQAGGGKNPLAEFQGCLGQSHSYYSGFAHPRYVVDTAALLERARDVYAGDFGRDVNASYIPVRGAERGARVTKSGTPDQILAIIDPAEARSSYSLGYINVHSNTECGSRGLGVTMAHELFHAVQSIDHLAISKVPGIAVAQQGLWWIESTAEYAAYKHVMKFDYPTNYDLDLDYFSEDFFSDGGRDENHPYKNAHFFDYLAGQGVAFIPLYNACAKSLLTARVLDAYLKDNTADHDGLVGSYRNWYRDVLFDGNGAYKGDIESLDVSSTTTLEKINMDFNPGLTSAYFGMVPEVDGPDGKRHLAVNIRSVTWPRGTRGEATDAPSRADVVVYRLPQNTRDKGRLIYVDSWLSNVNNVPAEICKVEIEPGDGLYIVATVNHSLGGNIKIEISDDPAIEIECADLRQGDKGTVDTGYEFKFTERAIPDGATYSWFIDDKDTGKTGPVFMHSFSEEGLHGVRVTAEWDGGSVTSNKYLVTIGTPTLSIKSPLDQGEKAFPGISYTFLPEPKYIPEGAEFTWYVNGKEIDGDREGADHAFELLTTYTIKVIAEWQVPEGGSRKIDSSLPFTVEAGFEILPDPIPGVVGEPSKFGITGSGIPASAGFTWDFGTQEGRMSTDTSDVKVTHTYEKAGTYPVSVTAIDRNTGKSLGKATFQYQVSLHTYVKIEPRPATAKQGDKINLTAKLYNMPESLTMAPRYQWNIYRDNVGTAQPKGESLSCTVDKPGQWLMQIVVDATDKNNRPIKGPRGDNWLEDSITITVEGTPTVILTIPSGEAGPNVEYTFTAVPTNIPKTAVYSWYVGEKKVVDAKENFLEVTFKTNQFRSAGSPYQIRVLAEWLDGNKVKQSAQDSGPFTVEEAATIALQIPSGEAGPAVKYVFTTDYKTVPRGAVYSWFVNGQKVLPDAVNGDRLTADPGFFMPGSYQIEVVAKWLDGNKRERSAKDSGEFIVKAPAQKPPPVPPPSQPVPVQEPEEPDDYEIPDMQCLSCGWTSWPSPGSVKGIYYTMKDLKQYDAGRCRSMYYTTCKVCGQRITVEWLPGGGVECHAEGEIEDRCLYRSRMRVQ